MLHAIILQMPTMRTEDSRAPRRHPRVRIAAAAAAFALTLAFGSAPSSPSAAAQNVRIGDGATHVQTTTGTVRGATHDGIASFKGIPYAAPPVGPLRWRAPQPPTRWAGVRAAVAYGPMCMQQWPSTDNGVGKEPPSEDCLVLNVWTPQPTAGAGLPVMVWIHGGGFVNGSGSPPLYDGTYLARQGVVVVTLNYRLGRLGFFAHPALTQEAGDAEPTGNHGLLDVIAALEWVHANVAGFGGDPGNVTVFGESAGGALVNRLMISPGAKSLFHRAIAQSGAGGETSRRLNAVNAEGFPSAEAAGLAFAETLGVSGDGAAALRALRAIPADRIIAATQESAFGGGGPMIDGRVVPTDVTEAFARGLEAQVPYLAGYNSLEVPASPENLDAVLARVLAGESADPSPLSAFYPDRTTLAASLVGDLIFAAPARRLVALHAANGAPAYLYRFDVISESMRGRFPGTPHAQERQYVFGTLDASPWPTDANDEVQARLVSAYWVDFAATGDPNGDDRPRWPRYSPEADELLDFISSGPEARPTPFAERLDAITAWRRAASASH